VTAITNTATPPVPASGSYLTNAFRQRVQKVVGSTTIQFVHDEAGHLIAESDASGTIQREYLWLDDMPVAMVDSTGVSPVLYYIHTDQLGTPQKITDVSMNVVWDGVFDPFGNPTTGASLSLTNLRFPGQYADGESGLSQNWHRDYDPATGRYIQSDLSGLEGGVNTYTYALNGPLVSFDVMGDTVKSNSRYFLDWLLGRGPRQRNYGRSTTETKEMMNSPDVEAMREQYIRNGC